MKSMVLPSASYNRAKWVCQYQGTACRGLFYVGPEARACPLWERCRGQDPQLEKFYPTCGYMDTRCYAFDPEQRRHHNARGASLRRAFIPERHREAAKRHYWRNKPEVTARNRERAAREREALGLGKSKRPVIPPPPCGNDCTNCPYDDDCHYPHWEEENDVYVGKSGRRVDREARRGWDKTRYAKQQKQRKTDPALDARIKAKNRCISCKGYYKRKFLLDGGTPEQYERIWAQVGGTPEGIRAAWKRAKKSAAQLVLMCAWENCITALNAKYGMNLSEGAILNE